MNATFSIKTALAALLVASATGAMAQSKLDQVKQAEAAKIEDGQRSQQRIDAIVASQQERLITYRALLKQIDGLEAYNEQLNTQIQGQQRLMTKFDESVDQVAQIERQMLPLIMRMAEALHSFVDLDLPFHETERRDRLAYIDDSIARADVDVAEKFRQVIEAYQIENEYGRKIDAYADIIELNGTPQEVDVLRVGRIALVAQTRDAATTAVWNNDAGRWDVLPAADYRNSVRQGILMAKKQASIDVVTLPIRAPEVAE